MLSSQSNGFLEKFWFSFISLLSKRVITQQFGPTSAVDRVRIAAGVATIMSKNDVYGFTLNDPLTQEPFNITQLKYESLVQQNIKLTNLIREKGYEAVMRALSHVHPLEGENLPSEFFPQDSCSDIDKAEIYAITDKSLQHWLWKPLLHGSTKPHASKHTHRTPRDGVLFTASGLKRVLEHISAAGRFVSGVAPSDGVPYEKVANVTCIMDQHNIERLCERYEKEMLVPITSQAETLATLTRDGFMMAVYWQLLIEIVSWFVSSYMPDDVKKYQSKTKEFFLLLTIPILLLTQPDLIITLVLFELLETMMRYLGLSRTLCSILVFILSTLTLIRQGIDDSTFSTLATNLGATVGFMTVKSARILAQQIAGYARSLTQRAT